MERNEIKRKFLCIAFINVAVFVFLFSSVILISDIIFKFYPKTVPEGELYRISERLEQNLPYDKNKPSIVTIGCSFVYGSDIEQEDTFAYKLQQYTGRKVYNYGTNGQSIQHVIFKLQKSYFFNNKDADTYIESPPQYLIYVFIPDHIRRMYSDYFIWIENNKYLRYKKPLFKRNNDLLVVKNPTWHITPWDFFIVSPFGRNLNHHSYEIKTKDETFNFLMLHFKMVKKELNKRFPDTKFVVVVLNPELNSFLSATNSPKTQIPDYHTTRWNELKDEGIMLINFDTEEYQFLNKKEYNTYDGLHPSGKAWDVMIPVITKKLGIEKGS